MARIRSELESGLSPVEVVKRLVSAYESCGRNYVTGLAARIPMTDGRSKKSGQIRFQNVDRSAKAMIEVLDVDPMRAISTGEAEFATKMSSRRHVYEHNAGVADQKYLEESGDDTATVGQAIRETSRNAVRLGPLLLAMMSNIDAGFRSIFPPEETAAGLKRWAQASPAR